MRRVSLALLKASLIHGYLKKSASISAKENLCNNFGLKDPDMSSFSEAKTLTVAKCTHCTTTVASQANRLKIVLEAPAPNESEEGGGTIDQPCRQRRT